MTFGRVAEALRNIELPILGFLTLVISLYALYEPELYFDDIPFKPIQPVFATDYSSGFKFKNSFNVDFINNTCKFNSIDEVEAVPLTYEGNIQEVQHALIEREIILPFHHKKLMITNWFAVKELVAVRDSLTDHFSLEVCPIRFYFKDKYGKQIGTPKNNHGYSYETIMHPVIPWITDHIDSIYHDGSTPKHDKYFVSVTFNEIGAILHTRY